MVNTHLSTRCQLLHQSRDFRSGSQKSLMVTSREYPFCIERERALHKKPVDCQGQDRNFEFEGLRSLHASAFALLLWTIRS
jgi:hypothetical protein